MSQCPNDDRMDIGLHSNDFVKLSDIEGLMNNMNKTISGLKYEIIALRNELNGFQGLDINYYSKDNFNILDIILSKDNILSRIQLKHYSNLFFNYFRKKLYNTGENNMLDELNTIENLFYNFIDKLQEKNIIPDGIESEMKIEDLNETNERNNKSISVEENIIPSDINTKDNIPLNGMKTESLNEMVESSELNNTTVLDNGKEDNKKINLSQESLDLGPDNSDTMDKGPSSSKNGKNNIPLTEDLGPSMDNTMDNVSSGGNENDNPNVQEDEKQNKIVHLDSTEHSNTGISEAHNPHCLEKNPEGGGGGSAAVEKQSVPFAANTHVQSGEASENRAGAQENPQTCNYTTQGENVQNRGTIRSERGMIDNLHTTDISQEGEKNEKDVITDEDLDPTKFIKVPTFEDFKEKYGDIDTIRDEIRKYAEENQDLGWYDRTYFNSYVCKAAKMLPVFDV